MKKAFIFTSLIAIILIVITYLYRNDGTNDSQVVNVYSSRKEELVRTLFDEFTKNTGIKVRYIIDDYSQLLSRMENGGEADLFLTADAINLILAKKRGLLSQVDSEVLKSVIPARFRDSEDYWFGLTKRARILVYNKESVDPKDLSTYEDLANEKWKGKILVRSSTSPYNRSLIAFMIANNGFEKTKEWVSGIVSNMARKPSGGDTDQIYAVAAGEGDVAIVNSYYFARILLSENKKNVADKLGAFFPNRNDHVNSRGLIPSEDAIFNRLTSDDKFKTSVTIDVNASNNGFQEAVKNVMSQPKFDIPVGDDVALDWTW